MNIHEQTVTGEDARGGICGGSNVKAGCARPAEFCPSVFSNFIVFVFYTHCASGKTVIYPCFMTHIQCSVDRRFDLTVADGLPLVQPLKSVLCSAETKQRADHGTNKHQDGRART